MMQWKVGVMDKFQRYFSKEDQVNSCSSDDEEDNEDFAAKESKLFGFNSFNRQHSYNQVSTDDDSFSRLKMRYIIVH